MAGPGATFRDIVFTQGWDLTGNCPGGWKSGQRICTEAVIQGMKEIAQISKGGNRKGERIAGPGLTTLGAASGKAVEGICTLEAGQPGGECFCPSWAKEFIPSEPWFSHL